MRDKTAESELRLIRSCEIANADREATDIQREFDAIPDEITEPSFARPDRLKSVPTFNSISLNRSFIVLSRKSP